MDYQIYIGDAVYYQPFPGATRERGIISSFPPDTGYIFVKYHQGSTAARTATSDLYTSPIGGHRVDSFYPILPTEYP